MSIEATLFLHTYGILILLWTMRKAQITAYGYLSLLSF